MDYHDYFDEFEELGEEERPPDRIEREALDALRVFSRRTDKYSVRGRYR